MMTISVGERLSRVRDWTDRLFPEDSRRWSGRRTWVAVVVAVVAGTALSLARTGGAGPFNSIWAEDAFDFLTDAVGQPLLAPFGDAMNGYYHFLPRTLAALARPFGVGLMPAVMSVEAALVTAMMAVFVFRASAVHVGGVVLQLVVALPVVAGPISGGIPNNVATLQFALLYSAFWALLWRPASRGGRFLVGLVVIVTALTSVLAALLVPLAVARWYVHRDRYHTVVIGSFLLGVLVQIVPQLLGLNPRGRVSDPTLNVFWAAKQYAAYAVPNGLLGQAWATPLSRARQVAGLLLLGAFVAMAFSRRVRPNWAVAALAAAFSVGFYGFTVMAHGANTERYAFLSGLAMLAALAALLRPNPEGGPAAMAPAAALLALVMILGAVNLRYPGDPRNASLPWDERLSMATAACRTKPDPDSTVVFRTWPGPPVGWRVIIPCRLLDPNRS